MRIHHAPARTDYEVAIIGGGLGGALLADALAAHTPNRIVLEAGRAGLGTELQPSGTATPEAPALCKMVMAIPEADASEIVQRHNPETLAQLVDIHRQGREALWTKVNRLCPQSGVQRGSWAFCSAAERAAFNAEREAYARAGRPVNGDAAELAKQLPGSRVADAFWLEGDSLVDGTALTRALLTESACEWVEGVVVRALKPTPSGWRIDLGTTQIEAGWVILATNSAHSIFGLKAVLRPRWTLFARWPSFGADTANLYSLGHNSLDIVRHQNWVRACGADSATRPSAETIAKRMRRLLTRVERHFPALMPTSEPIVEARRYSVTPDELPIIGELAPKLACLLGCNGMAHALWAIAAPALVSSLGFTHRDVLADRLLQLCSPERFSLPPVLGSKIKIGLYRSRSAA